MKVLLLLVMLLPFVAGHSLAAPAPETPTADAAAAAEATGADADEANDNPPQPDESVGAVPGNLQEAVRQTLEKFVPSEAIDVDKPVDFPTNI